MHFTLPLAHGSMEVVPSARLTPVTWNYNGRTTTDATPFSLTW